MTRQEMIDRVNIVKSPFKERTALYQIADELGIKYKKNNCPKCAKDLWNILREELGLIESAADESDFNSTTENVEYRFIHSSGGVYWKGRRYTQDTPTPYIKHFLKYFPKGYYEVIEKEDTPHTEETINNEE